MLCGASILTQPEPTTAVWSRLLSERCSGQASALPLPCSLTCQLRVTSTSRLPVRTAHTEIITALGSLA